MTTPATPAHTRPSWLALVALSGVVLGVHALLLTGGLPSFLTESPHAARSGTAQEVTLQTLALPADAPTALQGPSGLSTVRWLAPPTAPLAPLVEAPLSRLAAKPTPKTRPVASEPVADQPDPEQTPLANPEAPPIDASAIIDNSTPTASVEPMSEPPVASAALSEANRPIEPLVSQVNLPTSDPAASTAEDSVQLAAARPSRPATGEAQLPPAQPPASAQLNYAVTGKAKSIEYSATGRLDWAANPTAYTARMEIRVFLLGSRVQTSRGALVASGLQPERFGDKSRSERAAHFDRALGRVRFSNNAPDAELLPGAQDRLSVFFQLAGLLNARPEAYAEGQSVAMPVAGTGGSELWRFEVQGLESLNLPAGELIARHLVREPRQAHDTRVDIWLAPSLGHLPVRIRITQDNGDVVDQRLSTLP